MSKKKQLQGTEIQAVVKALNILETFSHNEPKLSLTELSQKTGFYKSTILRQTSTLIENGYLLRDQESEKYHLGPKLYILGRIYAQSSDLVNISPPIIKDLASKCGETVAVFIIDGFERVCLLRSQSRHFLQAVYEPGDRRPLHAGASGKVLLAYCDESLQKKLISISRLKKYTEKTITKPNPC